VKKTEKKESICNHDCLNCEHDGCINDAEPTEEEIRLVKRLTKKSCYLVGLRPFCH